MIAYNVSAERSGKWYVCVSESLAIIIVLFGAPKTLPGFEEEEEKEEINYQKKRLLWQQSQENFRCF